MQENPEESPYSPPKAPLAEPDPDGSHPGSHGQEITWGRTIAIWWSWGWRTGLLGGGTAVLLFLILQIIIGLVAAVFLAYALFIFISIRITQYVFQKDFENFYLRVVPDGQSTTLGQAVSIYWCYTWRGTVAMVVVSLLLAGLAAPFLADEPGPFYNFVQFALTLPIQVVVLRTVLRKKFRSFVIDIVPHRTADEP